MNTNERTEYVTRDSILKLLSDDEVSRVSNSETPTLLADGEEYLDLEHLEQGVRHGFSRTTLMKNALLKKAINPDTWRKILTLLATPLNQASA